MNHFVDRAVGSSADLAQVLQVFSSEVPVLLGRNLQLPTRLDTVIAQSLSVLVQVYTHHKKQNKKNPLTQLKTPSSQTENEFCLTYMCGLWKEGLADAMGSLAFGLIGGLAKFNFSALRLSGNKNQIYFALIHNQ